MAKKKSEAATSKAPNRKTSTKKGKSTVTGGSGHIVNMRVKPSLHNAFELEIHEGGLFDETFGEVKTVGGAIRYLATEALKQRREARAAASDR